MGYICNGYLIEKNTGEMWRGGMWRNIGLKWVAINRANPAERIYCKTLERAKTEARLAGAKQNERTEK